MVCGFVTTALCMLNSLFYLTNFSRQHIEHVQIATDYAYYSNSVLHSTAYTNLLFVHTNLLFTLLVHTEPCNLFIASHHIRSSFIILP